MVIRYLLWLILGVCTVGFGATSLSITPKTEEEALFLRRIAQFYEEKEFALVQKEISQYIEQYSESPFWYQLHGVLGDIYLNQGEYTQAINVYKIVKDPLIQKDLAINYLIALFKSENYSDLISKGRELLQKELLETEEDKQKLYFFMGSSLYELVMREEDIARKNTFAMEGKEYLEKVKEERHLLNAKERLAQIYSLLKEEKSSAAVYRDLAQRYPGFKERFLFQAAFMEVAYDKNEAIETFAEICHLGGELASDAALNRMILLFEEEKYSEVLLIKDQLVDLLGESHYPFLQYFLGKSYYLLEDYPRAVEALSTYVSYTKDKGQEEKAALLLYLSSAEKLEDTGLYSHAFTLFSEAFPEDPQLQKALLVRALLHKKKNDSLAALNDFHQIKDASLKEEKDLFYYEYALLLFDKGEKEKSYTLFSNLLKEFPESDYTLSAQQYLVQLSIDLHKEATAEHQLESKWQLIHDLKQLLLQKSLTASLDKKADYHLLLASHLFDVKEYAEAQNFLSPIVEQISDVNEKARAYLMLGWISRQLGQSPTVFCQYANQALSLSEALNTKADIHLALFNAYLSEAQEDSKVLSHAADHLYRVYQIDKSQITDENLLWLVQYYYGEAIQNNEDSAALLPKVIPLYAQVIEQMSAIAAEEHRPQFLESHILKYCDLLSMANETEKKIQFLESLTSQYDFLPQATWTSQPRAYFELAKSYQSIDNFDMAKKYYERVFLSSARSTFKAESMLEHSRIVLSQIKKEDFMPSNPDIRIALGRLKSVALQKSVITEPVHLQAAIEAVDLQCSCEKQMNPEKHLFLLGKLVETFTTQDDILSRQYHEALKIDVEKKKMIESYLALIEAEKAYWRAQMDEGVKEKAFESYQKLKEKQDQLSSYVLDRVDLKLESLPQTR